MALSKVMTSTTSTNSDLPRESSSSMCSLTIADIQTDQPKNLGSMNMEDLLKNIYSDSLSPDPFPSAAGAATGDGSFSLPKIVGNKTVDEVWKEIVAGGSDQRGGGGAGMDEMTLEDFLTKAGAGAGAVREEDVSLPVPVVVGPGSYGVDSSSIINGGHQMNGVRGGGGRAKRRAVEETVDKATQQKQRRMIKNRESAARSRERKQAYTVELESLVTQLEEENARLLREEAEESKKRFKQLMENLIPVVEKRRPPRVLRRVHSVQW